MDAVKQLVEQFKTDSIYVNTNPKYRKKLLIDLLKVLVDRNINTYDGLLEVVDEIITNLKQDFIKSSISKEELIKLEEIVLDYFKEKNMLDKSAIKAWSIYGKDIYENTILAKEFHIDKLDLSIEKITKDYLNTLFTEDKMYSIEGILFNFTGIKSILLEQFYSNQSRVHFKWDKYNKKNISNYVVNYEILPLNKKLIIEEIIDSKFNPNQLQIKDNMKIIDFIELFWVDVDIHLTKHTEYLLKEIKLFMSKLRLKSVIDEVLKVKQELVGKLHSNIFISRRFTSLIINDYINYINTTKPIKSTLDKLNEVYYTKFIREFSNTILPKYFNTLYTIHQNTNKLKIDNKDVYVLTDFLYKDLSGVKITNDENSFTYITLIGIYKVNTLTEHVEEVYIEKEKDLINLKDIKELTIPNLPYEKLYEIIKLI